LLQCHTPSLKTVAPPPRLPLDVKDWLKEDGSLLQEDFDWLLLTLLIAGVSPPEHLSAPRTLYTGFRKAKLKKS
jgi:hypothetical protein